MKTTKIPTVGGGKAVKAWDASVSFVTDAISFTGSGPWSVGFQASNFATIVGATLSVSVSNDEKGLYSSLGTAADVTDINNCMITGTSAPFRYMKLTYVKGTSTGSIGIIVVNS